MVFEKLKQSFSNLVDKLARIEFSERAFEKYEMDLILNLVESDVAYEVAEYIVSELKQRVVGKKVRVLEDKRNFLKNQLRSLLLEMFNKVGDIDFIKFVKEHKDRKPIVFLFLGPNGHGKTTTIAKIAYMFLKNNITTVIAASDTFRAGAIEQLEVHCKRLGIRLIKHKYGADPAAVAYDAIKHAKSKSIDTVLIDTAGRMQTDKDLMEEMKKIARVTSPDLKVFVGDALTGNDALEQARKFHEEVGIDCSILTKVDADTKGGVALSIVYATNKPIAYVGVGQNYKDLIKFDPIWFVNKILGEN